MRRFISVASIVAWVLMLRPSAVCAQAFTGRIDVTVQNAAGERLPGTVVDLAGPVLQTGIADPQGQVHFLNLPVGTYSVKATLSGFNAYVNNQVEVDAGAATALPVILAASGVEASAQPIVAATSAIDPTRQTTTTQVTLEELQDLPTPRDPWAVMQKIPALYLDRVNVGGSDSDEQAVFIGKGAVFTDNTWNIDGVPVTDMGAAGSSPAFYDFDMFRAISVTTGGADARNPTPGAQVSLVFKKGANVPHGNARMYFENERLQSTNIPATLVATLGGASEKGNRIDRFTDYGFEIGGPILLDYWWGWVSRGRTALRTLTLTGQPDKTTLKDFAVKMDGRPPNRNLRGNFTWFDASRARNGRGVSATRPVETGWNETAPTTFYKGEVDYVFHRLVASARAARLSARTDLIPAGGIDRNIYQDDSLVWHNSYFLRKTTRPQRYAGGDASLFAGRHELKFGFGWRRTPVESQSVVPGSKFVTYWAGYPNLLAFAQQDYASSTVGRYTSAFVTDTISFARLTLIGGARYDLQTTSLAATDIPYVLNVPFLPAVSVEPVKNVYRFRNLTPRIGATYAVDASRNTLVRGSYAQFASQLPANAAAFISPIQPDTYVYYNAVDRNSNGVADLNEIDFAGGVRGSSNIDRLHPGVFSAVNRVGDVTAPRTREILFGADREFTPDIAVSATFTWRHADDLIWNPPIGARLSDYRQTAVFTGNFPVVGAVSVPVYGITTGQIGREALNRQGYHRRYLAVEAAVTKRLSNRWMARAAFASSSWKEYFDDRSRAVLDPTPTPSASDHYASFTASGPLMDGGPVVIAAEGSGRSSIYMLPPRYQATLTAMYETPIDLSFAGSLAMRDGYARPYFHSQVPSGDSLVPLKNVLLVARPDRFRLDGVSLLDLRVEKRIRFRAASLAIDVDVFNALNRPTVLGRQYDARSAAFDQALEIMNPRIARLGLRFFF